MDSKKKIKSVIDRTKQVEYYESRELNQDDIKYETTIYDTDILGNPVAICLGKANYMFQYKNIVHFPVYLMRGDVIRSQIGLYEIYLDNLIEYSQSGVIDAEQIIARNKPLLYSFANVAYIEASGSSSDIMSSDVMPMALAKADTPKEDIEPPSAESKATDLQFVPKVSREAFEVFEYDKSAPIPERLPEETKPVKTDFHDSTSALWIQRYMENYDYRIIKIKGDGDCFFTSIQKAFVQIGKRTTIDKLRTIVANSITADTYDFYHNLYHMYISEEAELESNIEKASRQITDLRRRYKNIPETKQEERQRTHREIVELNERVKTYKQDMANATSNKSEYAFMNNVNSIQDLKMAVRDSAYWADEYSINIIENALNIKVIILSEKSFRAKDYDSVLKCQTSANKDAAAIFKPDYYIMLSYSGDHYELISYKDKNIFAFSEIPHKVKTLIVNKCIEQNDGTFGLIADFIQFQENLGIERDLSEEMPRAADTELDQSTVFMFHKKSAHEKPGKGSGETIDPANVPKYFELHRTQNWRQLLSDESTTPFRLDGKMWQSVEHYYQGAQFKKGFPDFYKLFSLDSDHEIAKDVEKAVGAGSKTGMYKGALLRPKTTKADPDFFANGRNETERAAAISAKIQTNEEARKVLILTRDAVLKHFVRGRPAEPDEILMDVRKTMVK